MTRSLAPNTPAKLTQLPGGWWRAAEVGGFARIAVAETPGQAWSELRSRGLCLVPADHETRLWVVDTMWNATPSDFYGAEPWGTRIADRHERQTAELRAFGRIWS